jgi:hypothetical protein
MLSVVFGYDNAGAAQRRFHTERTTSSRRRPRRDQPDVRSGRSSNAFIATFDCRRNAIAWTVDGLQSI